MLRNAPRTCHLLVNAHIYRLVILVLILSLIIVVRSFALLQTGTSEVPQGQGRKVYLTQNEAPDSQSGAWDIVNPSAQIVGSSNDTRGWQVKGLPGAKWMVVAPSSAPLGTGYKYRRSVTSGFSCGLFDVVPFTGTTLSTTITSAARVTLHVDIHEDDLYTLVDFERKIGANGEWQSIGSLDWTMYDYTDTGLDRSHSYYYRAYIKPYSGNNYYTDSILVTTKQFPSPIDIEPDPPRGVLEYPLTFPEWMEHCLPSDTSDAPQEGPASQISVDLPYGVADIEDDADLNVDNPLGPDIVFSRRYRTSLAAANVSSPGLPRGWTHNWDYRIITSVESPTSWVDLKLVYPNGATDVISPILGSNGQPTGQFTVPSGADYIVTGTPSLSNYGWQHIYVKKNGLVKRHFSCDYYGTFNFYELHLWVEEWQNGLRIGLFYSDGKLASLSSSRVGYQATAHLVLAYGATNGMLSSVTDSQTGRSRSFTYCNEGLASVNKLNSSAPEWTYQYATVANVPYISSVTGSNPHGSSATASINYDSSNARVSSTTDSKGNTRSYTYHDTGSTDVTITNSGQTLDSFVAGYDALGRVTANTSAAGDQTTCQYDVNFPGTITMINEPGGSTYSVTLDNKGNPTRIEYPYGNYTTYQWQYPTEAPLGRIQSYTEYGNNGSTKPTVTFTYNGSSSTQGPGLLSQVADGTGWHANFSYTELGSIASMSAGNQSASFDYVLRDNNNNIIASEWYGRPYAVRDSAGKWTRFLYDSLGRMNSVQSPSGSMATASYNQHDQPTSILLPYQTLLQTTYQVPGKAATSASISVPGFSQSLGSAGFDSESALSSMTNPISGSISSILDANYDLKSVTNEGGNVMHQFAFNPLTRTYTTAFGTGSNSRQYTAVLNTSGALASVTGTDGRSAAFSYLATDPSLISSATFSEGGYQLTDTYTYDAFGRSTVAATSAGNQRTYTYNSSDQPTSDNLTGTFTTYSQPTYNYSSEVFYTYNADKTRSRMYVLVDASYMYVCYSYTYSLGRISNITVNYADQYKNIVSGQPLAYATYNYDDDGNVVKVKTPQAVILYSYDALGQLTELQNLTPDGKQDINAPSNAWVTDPYDGQSRTVLASFTSMTYDLLGNRTGMNILANTTGSNYITGSASWTFDQAGRLLSENWGGGFGPSVARTYGLSPSGNLTSYRGYSWSIDALTDRMVSSSDQNYSGNYPLYTSSGELRRCGYYWVGYNEKGLMSSSTGLAPFKSSGYDVEYDSSMKWDTSARRVFQYALVRSQGWIQQKNYETYTYDDDELIRRHIRLDDGHAYEPSDLLKDPNINGDPVPEIPVNEDQEAEVPTTPIEPGVLSSTYYNVLNLWGPTGLIMEFDLSGHSRTFTFDPQGSCVATSKGRITNPMFYDAYGSPVWTYANDDRNMRQPFQYKGQFGYFTDPNGLINCGVRFYDYRSGRWTSPDPIGLDGGVNVYAYCYGNPLMFADPYGTDGITDFFAGWGDTLTFGGTKIARKYLGEALGIGDANEAVDYDSSSYGVGTYVGTAHSVALDASGGWKLFVRFRGFTRPSWQAAEKALAKNYKGASQQFFRTAYGRRFVDQFAKGVAHEAKYGRVHLTSFVKTQIKKDVELMATGKAKKVVWHFYRSNKTNLRGPSKQLIDELKKNGIKIKWE